MPILTTATTSSAAIVRRRRRVDVCHRIMAESCTLAVHSRVRCAEFLHGQNFVDQFLLTYQ